MISRAITVTRRMYRARQMGLRFTRSRTWRVPDRLLVAGTVWPLRLPSDVGTKTATVDIWLDDCYGLRILPRRTVHTILDVGAHAGIFSLYARTLFPDAIIHAYEPNTALAPNLAYHAGVGRFECFSSAVGSQNGFVSLLTDATDSVQTKTVADPRGLVPQIAFRECIVRLGSEVDFVKLDCEGAEWDIFSDRASWRAVKKLAMEYHLTGAQTVQHVLDTIAGLGFRVQRLQRSTEKWGIVWATNSSTDNSR